VYRESSVGSIPPPLPPSSYFSVRPSLDHAGRFPSVLDHRSGHVARYVLVPHGSHPGASHGECGGGSLPPRPTRTSSPGLSLRTLRPASDSRRGTAPPHNRPSYPLVDAGIRRGYSTRDCRRMDGTVASRAACLAAAGEQAPPRPRRSHGCRPSLRLEIETITKP
jgi:hypothetical protein